MIEKILQIFYALVPVECLHCQNQRATGPQKLLCEGCQELLQQVDTQKCCGFCGVPLISEQDNCLDCRESVPPFASLKTLWWYDGAGISLLRSYKFEGEWVLGRFFAAELSAWLKTIPGSELAVLCPLPSGWRLGEKRMRRPLAKILKWLTGWSVQSLIGRRTGLSQKKLGYAERLTNALELLFLKKKPAEMPPWVILIDDVYTTGATIRTASALLRNAGVGRVDCFCFFRD